MPTVASVNAAIQRNGRAMVLRRVVNGAPDLDLTLQGISHGGTPEDIVSNVTQTTTAVTIGTTEIVAQGWPAPPLSGDRILRDGRVQTIQSAEPVYLRGKIAKYVLTVKG